MQIHTEEKKHALSVLGVCVAACRVLYPAFEGKEKINAFYGEMAENLLAFFRKKAEAHGANFEALPRREKRGFPQLRMNMFFSVTYAESGIISLTREYVLCEGKTLLTYRKSGEIWSAEHELLLPPRAFFPHKLWKTAEKNEFYFDGEAVLVENRFPEAVGDGRHTRLSDYIKETRIKK
ncbi:MAG: hypothetical protein IJW21_01405 [Clostridia bacterium]|nr:hypothetical protein [Clostridia bacterium]